MERKYYYSYHNGIKLKTYSEAQEFILKKCLNILEAKGLPINGKKIKSIFYCDDFRFPGYSAFAENKSIYLNSYKFKKLTIKNETKELYSTSLLLAHEIVHILDGEKETITRHFKKDYWKKLKEINEITTSSFFKYKESHLKSIARWGLPMYRKASTFSYYERVHKKNAAMIGLPSAYSLVAPFEFSAELLSYYLVDKESIKDKNLKNKIKAFFKKK